MERAAVNRGESPPSLEVIEGQLKAARRTRLVPEVPTLLVALGSIPSRGWGMRKVQVSSLNSLGLGFGGERVEKF